MDDRSKEFVGEMRAKVYQSLEQIGYMAETNVKMLVPVDTGRLKQSITHSVSDNSVTIGTNVEYGKYVEYNDRARHYNGQAHYLRDGINKNIKQYEDIIYAKLKSSI